MNFEKLPPVETPKQLLDISFKKSQTAVAKKKFTGKPVDRAKDKAKVKIDVFSGYLQARLRRHIKAFPSFEHLPKFYIELIKLTLEVRDLKQSLAALNWAEGKVITFQKIYTKNIAAAREYETVQKHLKEFYGRVSSVVKQITVNIEYLNYARKIMKTYPDVKERFTVALYGFPNVGKSTLLNKLTGTTAKTAAYSFTTKSINCGFLDGKSPKDESAIQILDVPGTLARPEKMNLIELQADLVAKQLADLIIYIFDVTEPFPLEEQKRLFKKIKKERSVICFLSKQDIISDEQRKIFTDDLGYDLISLDDLKKKIIQEAKKHESSKSN